MGRASEDGWVENINRAGWRAGQDPEALTAQLNTLPSVAVHVKHRGVVLILCRPDAPPVEERVAGHVRVVEQHRCACSPNLDTTSDHEPHSASGQHGRLVDYTAPRMQGG